MREVFEALSQNGAKGEVTALATVVNTKGSAPRGAGAKMVVLSDGTIVGTIGGGCIEAEVWQRARDAMKTNQPVLMEARLTADAAGDSGMICGGTMEVLVEPVAPGTSAGDATIEVFEQVLAALNRREPTMLATVVRAGEGQPAIGTKLFVKEDGAVIGPLASHSIASRIAEDCQAMLRERRATQVGQYALDEAQPAIDVYLEAVRNRPAAIIVGAGHVGAQLATVAKGVGFEVVVIDDRPDFADANRFPQADRVVAGDMAETLRGMSLGADTYVVLVTRGHKQDEAALRAVVSSDAAYIGMIGSRVRVRTVKERLVRDGVPRERVERIYSPIGLDIGAETPEEIALSIVAEMVMVMRGGEGQSLRDRAGR